MTGQRGGTGFTAGRRSEVIASKCGTYRKRVFKGQRWLLVSRSDECDKLNIESYQTKERAEVSNDFCYKQGYLVHFVIAARSESV
jgi:hypothetical protein